MSLNNFLTDFNKIATLLVSLWVLSGCGSDSSGTVRKSTSEALTSPAQSTDPQAETLTSSAAVPNTQPKTEPEINQPLNDVPAISEGNTKPGNIASQTASPVRLVDCNNTIPCSWRSDGGGIELTVVNVQTNLSTQNLEILYSVRTLRDTKLRWLASTLAIDSTLQKYDPDELDFIQLQQDIIENREIDLLAGIDITVRQGFRQSPAHATRTIARFTTEILEGNQTHAVGFLDLPIDSLITAEVDCAGILPCQWVAGSGDFTLTIVTAEGLQAENRLTVHFNIEVHHDITISSNPGSTAIGNDGTIFTPKHHSIGNSIDYRSFDTQLFAGSVVTASQSYFRSAQKDATSLKTLVLMISQLSDPNVVAPTFTNVPLF